MIDNCLPASKIKYKENLLNIPVWEENPRTNKATFPRTHLVDRVTLLLIRHKKSQKHLMRQSFPAPPSPLLMSLLSRHVFYRVAPVLLILCTGDQHYIP